MTCKARTPIFSDDNVSTSMMERTSADDAAECVDTQIGSNTGDWIGYQATGLNRIDAIIMGLLTISVLASFAGCVPLAIRSDTIWACSNGCAQDKSAPVKISCWMTG